LSSRRNLRIAFEQRSIDAIGQRGALAMQVAERLIERLLALFDRALLARMSTST
jgi:hypothetical protein